jgi:hypothetical protein
MRSCEGDPHVAWRPEHRVWHGSLTSSSPGSTSPFTGTYARAKTLGCSLPRQQGVVLMPTSEAVDTMLARCEHDVLDLYRSTDPVYVRYRSQVVTFARTVGASWDGTTPL